MARVLIRGSSVHSLPHYASSVVPMSLHREPLPYAESPSIVPPSASMQAPLLSSTFAPLTTAQISGPSSVAKTSRSPVPAIFTTVRSRLSFSSSTQSLPVSSPRYSDPPSSSPSPMLPAIPSTVLPPTTIVPHSSFVRYYIRSADKLLFYLTILYIFYGQIGDKGARFSIYEYECSADFFWTNSIV